jgi:hypothetical protein
MSKSNKHVLKYAYSYQKYGRGRCNNFRVIQGNKKKDKGYISSVPNYLSCFNLFFTKQRQTFEDGGSIFLSLMSVQFHCLT